MVPQKFAYRRKSRAASQEGRRATANLVVAAAQVSGPAANGSVVVAQTFTPRVSGRVRAVACVAGVVSNAAAQVAFTVTVNGQPYSQTITAGGGANLHIATALDHVFTGLAVGTPVNVTFTWSVGGGVITFDLNGEGALVLQEIPN